MQKVRNKNGTFVKGGTPWNKGKTGYMGANVTSFKPGEIPPNTQPKGHIALNHKHGKVQDVKINIDWKGNRKPNNSHAWYVWEVYHQEDRPKGYVMYHLDGDNTNNDIDNLEPITRAELMRRNNPKASGTI